MSLHGNETVYDRIQRATIELSPIRLAIALVLIAAIGFSLLFLQEPLVHDSLHNFRHSIGATCH